MIPFGSLNVQYKHLSFEFDGIVATRKAQVKLMTDQWFT